MGAKRAPEALPQCVVVQQALDLVAKSEWEGSSCLPGSLPPVSVESPVFRFPTIFSQIQGQGETKGTHTERETADGAAAGCDIPRLESYFPSWTKTGSSGGAFLYRCCLEDHSVR